MKKLLTLGALAIGMLSQNTWANVCLPVGGAKPVSYDITNVFTSQNNRAGEIVTLPGITGNVGVQAVCPPGGPDYTLGSFVTELPVMETSDGGWQYLKINDYLWGAVKIFDDVTGETLYPPLTYKQRGTDWRVSSGVAFDVRDSLTFRLKVTRPFVNQVPIPNQVMFRVYVTQSPQDPLTDVVYTIRYSGTVEVPQTCEIDAGQIVEFNFGNIGAATFSDAGAGGKPAQVTQQTKNIAISCTNIAQQALLTLRVEAQRTNNGGDIMVSDNPDVGFKVANGTGTPLTPNNISSIIPFQLDSAATAVVPIIAWPVSVTGNRPAEGPFKASGYLRVDYQ